MGGAERTLRLRRCSAGALAACALAVCASTAAASDSSTTDAYLRANYALVKAGDQHLGTSIADYRGVLSKVRGECPRGAARSPQNPESTQLSNEAIGAMVLSAGIPDRPAIHAFLSAAAGLRWSSARVTHEVSAYVTSLRKLYALSVPNLCGDIASWAGTHFSSLPSSTVSFDRVFYPNWVALGLVPPGISRFEDGEGQRLAKSAERIEYVLTNAEAEAVEWWEKIMNELELNP